MGKILEKIKQHTKVSDAFKDSDGVWVYLKDGWGVDGCPGEHCIVEDRVADAYRKVKSAVPCSCKQCKP